jgi:peptide/nickel transport system substrate-binding protein
MALYLAVLAIIAAVSIPLGGVSSHAAQGDAAPVELVVALTLEPRSLDPAYNYEFASYHVVNHINEGLLYYTPDSRLANGLAESWEQADATTYVYRIRQGVRFSDGSPLTVEDVLFSLERIKDPALAADTNWMYSSVDTIKQTGEWEITVKLNKPDANWKYVLATSAGEIVSKKFVEAAGDSFGKPGGGTLGTGPYKLDKWVPGSQFVLSRNEHYWNKKENFPIDKVTVNIIPDMNSVGLALESGQADFFIRPSKEILAQFEGSKKFKIVTSPSLGNAVVSFNTKKSPFDDANVRKAVASAIDSAGIRKSQVGEYAADAGALPFGEKGYTIGDFEDWKKFNASLPLYSYDMEKAKRYLAQSSVPKGFSTSIILRPNQSHNNIAQIIQASLKELNIGVEVRQLTASEYYGYVYGGKITNGIRDYDMSINLWIPDFPDPIGHLIPQYYSTNAGAGGSNFAAYSNPKVDALCDEQSLSADDNERSKLIQRAFAIAAEESPYKYLFYDNNTIIINKKFDYALSPVWIFNFSYKDIKLAE